MTRQSLPQRRGSYNFTLNWGGFANDYSITVGLYDDGHPGEIFITGAKSGAQTEAIARDSAILVSLSLQHGVSLETIASAITRDSQGTPSSIVGAVIDRLTPKPEGMA